MTVQFSGAGSVPSRLANASISSSTNASPIEITTGAAHGLRDGQRVLVQGHETNYTANGLWTITIVSTTKFTLDTSNGVAIGGATGTVTPYVVTPTYGIMSDLTDDLDAAHLNLPSEALGDRTQWLAERLGYIRLEAPNSSYSSNAAPAAVPVLAASGTATGAAWTSLDNGGSPLWTSADITIGDGVIVECSTTVYNDLTSSAGAGWIALFGVEYEYGATPSFGSASLLSGSARYLPDQAIAGQYHPVHLLGEWTSGFLTHGGAVAFCLAACAITGGSTGTVGIIDYKLRCTVVRPQT